MQHKGNPRKMIFIGSRDEINSRLFTERIFCILIKSCIFALVLKTLLFNN